MAATSAAETGRWPCSSAIRCARAVVGLFAALLVRGAVLPEFSNAGNAEGAGGGELGARLRAQFATMETVDGALARRPQILLVDELAHSNVEGSRHPKRWQDVEELLAAAKPGDVVEIRAA